MSTDLLEKRLESLEVPVPDAGNVTARVLSHAPQPASHRIRRFVAAGVATVVLIGLVGYFVPAADTALASTPAGDLLRDAGLAGAKDRITWVGASDASSGIRLQLVGAYSDSTRTVLLLHSDPPSYPDSFTADLTDQFGRHYHSSGSRLNMLTGNMSADFEPLAWPDAITGARISLHISTVRALVHPYEVGQPTQFKDVQGSWTLRATLGVDETATLTPPSPADLGPAHFTFTSVRYSAATVAVDADITGVTSEELNRRIPDGFKGKLVLTASLIDPSGEVIGGGLASSSNGSPVHLRVLGYRLSGAGDYVIRINYFGAGEFERVLKIP
jgi:hypothetical protein